PHCFGGESEDENLLPACGKCNSTRKRDFASWALVHIHSLSLGMNPSVNALKSVDGTLRFALQYHAARKLAEKRKWTLRAALLRLGPWTEDPRVLDETMAGDFFNLAIHSPYRDLERD